MARKIALLIGVGQYGPGLKTLNCPANGVEAMRSLLQNPNIGEFDQVIPLINPSLGEMRTRIGETFAEANKEDLVLLYFTGHGIKDSYGKFYLTTTESYLFENGDINVGTAVEADFIKGAIARCYAERKVVILDCCFAGAIADGFIGMDDGSIDIAAQLNTRELGEKGCCVLTASTSTRYALEPKDEALSVYTRYLTEGLRTGGAAPEEARFISARQLHDYVKAQVKVAAPAMQPAIFNALEGDRIAIARVQIDNEQRYRKQVQAIVKQVKGRLRPAAKANLKLWQRELGIAEEKAAAILAEVLKPYEEKAKHVEFYQQTLIEEKEYGYPLDAEAVEQLHIIKRRLNLRDTDVLAAEEAVLGSPLAAIPAAEQLTLADEEETPQEVKQESSSTSSPSSRFETFSFETVRVNEKGEVIETVPGKAECFSKDLGNGITLEMVRIPGGKFLMGAAEGEVDASEWEYPQHEVIVPEFWTGKYAVTQEQWAAVAALEKIDCDLTKDPAYFKGAKRPVEGISWKAAVEFCKRLSQRSKWTYALPSEAQWEYACRAGTTTPFHFGETLSLSIANYYAYETYGSGEEGELRRQTTEVGSFPGNAFGLYDMHGNVYEWCQDDWHDSYEGAPTNGDAWKSLEKNDNKVRRGGSWCDNPGVCRSAQRGLNTPDFANYNFGFRVSCSAPRT